MSLIADMADARATIAACRAMLPAAYHATIDTWYAHAASAGLYGQIPRGARRPLASAVARRVVEAIDAARALGLLPRIV